MPPQLLNRGRAAEILARAGLDALVLAQPLNVYYATSKPPVLDRMTTTCQSVAVVAADADRPVAYVGPAFEYYYNVADTGLAPGVDLHLVSPAGDDPLMSGASAMMRVLDKAPLEPREHQRRARTSAARFHSSVAAGLAAAFAHLGARPGRVGIDSLEAQQWAAAAVPGVETRPAEDLVRHIRLVKTSAEIALLSEAAMSNARAVLAAIQGARAAPTLQSLRARFFSEAALRGNTPIFMLVDGVMDESYDEPLVEGRAFLVDGVSHRGFYQGDYARTACLGEPGPELRRIAAALQLAWGEVRSQLRPGLRFSEIRAIGLQTLRTAGYDYTVAFKPHCVGLAHEDQPKFDVDGGPLDLALEADMVLSVDCPLLDVGVGGTAHLEDLTLITADGSRPLHAVDPPLILV
jgi:Xaa-Pro aminopeptidase